MKKNKIVQIIKLDIFEEVLFSLIGCLFFLLLFNFFPKSWHFVHSSEENFTARTIVSILVLSFLFLFLILNQNKSQKSFFKINYKRNIILFSIFFFAAYSYLFYNTPFGIKNILWTANQDLVKINIASGEPFRFFRYFFLVFFYLIPIGLYESWKKIYSDKISFFISIASSVIILDPFFIDYIIGVLFFIPFFLFYFENIKNIKFKKTSLIIAGLFGSVLFLCFSVIFLIIPIYLSIKLIQNENELKMKLKNIFLIILFIAIFSSWFWIPILINFVFVQKGMQNNYFYLEYMGKIYFFEELLPFSIIGVILFVGLLYILKNYTISKEIRILGNLLLSVFILFLILFIGILFNFPSIPIQFMRMYMYILIISASLFYSRFFNFVINSDILKKYKLKGNFQQVEISFLIILIFSQTYLNIYNVYTSSYHRRALKVADPDEILSSYKEEEYKEQDYFVDYFELAIINSIYELINYLTPFIKFNSYLILANNL